MATKQQLLDKMRQAQSEWETPGLWEYVAQNPNIRSWLDNVQKEMNDKWGSATDDEYELLTSSYLRGVKKAARMHSEAEWAKLKEAGGSVLDLDLRFARYIEFSVVYKTRRGKEYVLYGAAPRVDPDRSVYWGTAQDWWVALRSESACAAIQLFGALPKNERSQPLELDETITRMDFTKKEGGQAVIKVEKVKREQRRLF